MAASYKGLSSVPHADANDGLDDASVANIDILADSDFASTPAFLR